MSFDWVTKSGGVPPPINPKADLEYMKTPEYEKEEAERIEIGLRISLSIPFNPPSMNSHEYFEYKTAHNKKLQEAFEKKTGNANGCSYIKGYCIQVNSL